MTAFLVMTTSRENNVARMKHSGIRVNMDAIPDYGLAAFIRAT
jgi:hypothetical protein